MLSTRAHGLSHLYFDPEIDGFSSISVGMLVRALGAGLSIAYVDVQGTGKKFTNFLENLSLSHSFTRKFDKFHVECFDLSKGSKISKSILPLVEFYSIDDSMFWSSLDKFDCVIFDNITLKSISKYKIQNFLQNRSHDTEVLFTCKEEKEVKQISEFFDYNITLEYKKSPLLNTHKNIMAIYGGGRGKSTFSFGYIVKSFFEKKNVKLVYFDKHGSHYSERIFFSALKKWISEHSIYGSFDFVETGLKRLEGKNIRLEITEEDKTEARDALMLLKTALKKQTPVVAEELNDAIEKGLIDVKEVLPLLENTSNELVITGEKVPKGLQSHITSHVKLISEKAPTEKSLRKGIDF